MEPEEKLVSWIQTPSLLSVDMWEVSQSQDEGESKNDACSSAHPSTMLKTPQDLFAGRKLSHYLLVSKSNTSLGKLPEDWCGHVCIWACLWAHSLQAVFHSLPPSFAEMCVPPLKGLWPFRE